MALECPFPLKIIILITRIMNIDSTVYWSIVVLSVMKRVDFGTLELYVTMCICDRRDGVCRRKNMELRRE